MRNAQCVMRNADSTQLAKTGRTNKWMQHLDDDATFQAAVALMFHLPTIK